MRLFKNILLVYNHEFASIKTQVYRLVQKHRARLTIIDVFDNIDQYRDLMPASSSVDEFKALISAERRLEIKAHFKSDSASGNPPVVTFKFGNPAVEVIKEAIRGKYDLVVKAATGKKNLNERLFGNVAVKLLRKCPCPVLVVKPVPSPSAPFQKILAPVDPEPEKASSSSVTKQGAQICNAVMDIAVSLALLENGQLDVLHCWFLPGETMLASGRTRIAADKLDQMLTLAEKVHTGNVNQLVSQYDLSAIRHSVVIRKGDPSTTIIDYARQTEVDLIVMGTIGHSSLSGLLIGSTAEKVLDRIDCSVLTVKSADFKSPITV